MDSAAPLWAITSYFNPIRYRQRLVNYRVFRQRLNVPLVAVELAYADAFELRPDDAEILIQLRGRDVMWQKERLLNVALAAVPRHCHMIAWVDCDVLFGRDDWPDQTCRLLEQFPLVQLFREAFHLPQHWRSAVPRCRDAMYARPSVPFDAARGKPIYQHEEAGHTRRLLGAPGRAWAAGRELLEAHRFYDACILGSGDAVMALAAYGHFDDACRHVSMNELQRAHYLAWATAFHDAVCGALSYVPVDLFHLWHGSHDNRGYQTRWAELAPFQFDPFRDMAPDPSGCWRWSSDKPAMHRYVGEYFASRREDG